MQPEMESTITQQAVKIAPFVRAKIPPDDFDDVMQDIMISFWVSLPKYRGEAQLSTYAHAIAKHRIADYWRKAYVRHKTIKAVIRDYPQIALSQKESSNEKKDRLTPAEKEIFKLLGRGMSNIEISAVLYRSVSTVRSHLKKIYKKFECHDRVKVALLANKIFEEEKK